jgi:CheY-like chemotaxis protein
VATTILVVDDSATMRKVLEMTFAGEDAQVVTCASGGQALQQITDVRPDIVIADVSMPAPDGYDIARSIRQNAATSHIAVLLMTSQHTPYDAEKGRSCGVDDSISKPFDSQAMIDRVQQVLSRPRSVVSGMPRPAASSSSSTVSGSASTAAKPGRTATVMFGSQQPPAPVSASNLGNGPKPTPAAFSQPIAMGSGVAPRAPSGKPILELAEEEPPSGSGITEMDSDLLLDAPESIQPSAMHDAVPTNRPHGSHRQGLDTSTNRGSATRDDSFSGREHTDVRIHTARVAGTDAPLSAPSATPPGTGHSAVTVGTQARENRVPGLSREQLSALGLTTEQVQAVLALSREVIEKVVWEVVPELAETMIREEIQRITRE